MTIRRTFTSGVAVASLLLLVAAPAGAATTTGSTAYGTATTTSVPLLIEAGGETVELGRTVLTASTDDEVVADAPWSAVALTLADVAGTAFGEVAVTSDGTTSSPGTSITETTAVGGVTATVADLLAVADDTAGSATAALTSLATEATVLDALDLGAEITNVAASVDATGATTRHALEVDAVDLDVAALLGSILAELPLDLLLDLAGELGVTVPDGLGDASAVVNATETLLVDVAAAIGAVAGVEGAAAALLAADNGPVADLEALIGRVESIDLLSVTLVSDVQSILDDVPATCDVDLGSLTIDQTLLDGLVTCLEAEIDGLLGPLVLALDSAVTTYLEAVDDVVDSAGLIDGSSLSSILDGLTELIDGLLAVELGGIGPIGVTQQATAIGGSLEGSSASHTCQVTTITVPGADDVDVAGCDGSGTAGLQAALDTITGTLGAVLSTVGGVDVGDGVSLDLFGNVQDTVTEGEGGTVTATSVMEVLALTVPDITVAACDVTFVGDLVCALGDELGGQLDGLLAPLADAATDLTNAQNDVVAALGTVDFILAALVVDIPVSAGTAAAGAVQAVLDALDGLDLGTLGEAAGLTIPGARIVVDPVLVAEHTVVAAAGGTPDPAPNPAPNPAPTPGSGPLPNTGGGAALVAILALGAGAWLWRRREA